MKILKVYSQIVRPHRMKNRTRRVTHTASLVLAVICLTSGLALPTHCRSHHASTYLTTQPASNSGWTITGDLNLNHYVHTATLLPNGKVLVAGGGYTANSSAAPRAELYDPDTGTWSYTGSLNTARMNHTATLLQNGQVLVAGGVGDVDGSHYLKSGELYDPATGQWRPTGSFNTIRNLNSNSRLHSTTLLLNGKVLAVGASRKNTLVVDSAEIYDPATGTWSATEAPSAGGSTALLPSGKVLIVSRNSAELYDPDTQTWSSTGAPNRIGSAAAVTLLRNGKVLVTGWSASGSFSVGYPVSAELYDTATETWSITGSLNAARDGEYRSTLLADGRVLVAGGYASYSAISGEELYDPDTGTWSFTGRLNAACDYHTATLLQNGQVLVAGGVDGFYDLGNFLNRAELYDPAIAPIPIAIPRIISASVDGKKLVVVGENFDRGAVILLNGLDQKTSKDSQNPQTALICKKAGKKLKPGDTLQVLNLNGTLSQEFTFTSP